MLVSFGPAIAVYPLTRLYAMRDEDPLLTPLSQSLRRLHHFLLTLRPKISHRPSLHAVSCQCGLYHWRACHVPTSTGIWLSMRSVFTPTVGFAVLGPLWPRISACSFHIQVRAPARCGARWLRLAVWSYDPRIRVYWLWNNLHVHFRRGYMCKEFLSSQV